MRQRLGQRLHVLLELAAMLVQLDHRRLACLPFLRLFRQFALLAG